MVSFKLSNNEPKIFLKYMKAFSRVDVNIVKFAQSLHKKFVCDIKLAAAACAQQFMDDIF